MDANSLDGTGAERSIEYGTNTRTHTPPAHTLAREPPHALSDLFFALPRTRTLMPPAHTVSRARALARPSAAQGRREGKGALKRRAGLGKGGREKGGREEDMRAA